jgi:hypothetical protein
MLFWVVMIPRLHREEGKRRRVAKLVMLSLEKETSIFGDTYTPLQPKALNPCRMMATGDGP